MPKSLLAEIADELRPDSQPEAVEAFIKDVNSRLRRCRFAAKAVAGGSLEKGTFIKGDFDVDIFVIFAKSYAKKNLSDLLERAIKPLKPVRLHGSRDYFQVKRELCYEVVPVLAIKNAKEAANLTDVSPLHARWVKAKIKAKPRLADEIRLAKKFCKAQLCYGAESFIGGLSGHVLDILVIHYSSFPRFIAAAAKWKQGQVIDSENYHKGKALFNLNKSKLGPLIVIDPMQPDRNAAAALSEAKFVRLKEAAQRFLKKQDRSFFTLPSFVPPKHAVIITVVPESDKYDVAGAKLKHAFAMMLREVERLGFKAKQAAWAWDSEATFAFVLRKSSIAAPFTVAGPLASQGMHAERFRRAHKNTFAKAGRLFARERRAITTAPKLAERLRSLSFDGVMIKKKERKNPQKSLCEGKIVDSLIFKYY
ncbi:MAG: nucleotidyltransferase domain-containing protein [Nanoarchaeota archaeon]